MSGKRERRCPKTSGMIVPDRGPGVTMWFLLVSLLSCDPHGGVDVPPEGDADTDSDVDSDTDADTVDTGPWLEPCEPGFSAGFGTETFEAQDGRWLVVGAETWLTGTRDSHQTSIDVVVSGDLTRSGTFDVRTVKYRSAFDEDTWEFQYTGSGGATFVVEGHDAAGELLWGHLEGSVALTDTQGGPDIALDSLVLVSWPQEM